MKELKTASINTSQPWQEYPAGLEVNEGGTSVLNRTGDWRTKAPYWDQEKCKQCLMCTPYCPDSSIPVVDGKRTDFDYDHCKGCGICFTVCPFKAIRWEEV
jgi:pyruvate ferredoxin oxidoreductase delta subunit